MMTEAMTVGPLDRHQGPVRSWVRSMVKSFRWAKEMQRRCEAEMARGRRLDGAAIRRIADEVDAWMARR